MDPETPTPTLNRSVNHEVGADKRLTMRRGLPILDSKIQSLADHVKEHGYVIIEDAFSSLEIAEAKAELLRLSKERASEQSNPASGGGKEKGRNTFEGLKTERIYALANKSRVFDKFALNPDVLALNDYFLEPGYLLNSFLSINIQPGEQAQTLHYDDGYITIPRPHSPFGTVRNLQSLYSWKANNLAGHHGRY
jgi:hypothetical protein